MSIQSRIKSLREQKRLSQYDMADSLGISQSSYLQMEKGKTELTVNRLFQIAQIFNVSINALLSEETNSDSSNTYVKELQEKVQLLESENKTLKASLDTINKVFTMFATEFKGKENLLAKIIEENPIIEETGKNVLSHTEPLTGD